MKLLIMQFCPAPPPSPHLSSFFGIYPSLNVRSFHSHIKRAQNWSFSANFTKAPNIKFHENRPSGSKFDYVWTRRHDETGRRFS